MIELQRRRGGRTTLIKLRLQAKRREAEAGRRQEVESQMGGLFDLNKHQPSTRKQAKHAKMRGKSEEKWGKKGEKKRKSKKKSQRKAIESEAKAKTRKKRENTNKHEKQSHTFDLM